MRTTTTRNSGDEEGASANDRASAARTSGLYVQMFSVHGLIRGSDLELGRDADTGGQSKYVVEVARALGERDDVERLDLITRRIHDPRVSSDYDVEIEDLSPHARIVRLSFGGNRYRRKELLWPHLDALVTEVLRFNRRQERQPDVVHGHYADAGYVAMEVAGYLGVPFVFTGHSLGRTKHEVLRGSGLSDEEIDERYHIHHRIEVEEACVRRADVVIASTRHEMQRGYELYESAAKANFEVLPPGIDVDRFYPYYYDLEEAFDPGEAFRRARVHMRHEIARFLNQPDKPLILAVSRPDRRKNIEGLITAYGEDKELQSIANLAVFAGVRRDIRDMSDNEREVLTELLMLMDRYDLYGKLALPKKHDPETDIPVLYRLAAVSGGVFINPALTENFGITLIEASSSGLPVVSTDHGGPQDIITTCDSGVLIDTRDTQAMQQALKDVLVDRELWERYSRNGVDGVREHFAWRAHAERYLEVVSPLVERSHDDERRGSWRTTVGSELQALDRLLVSDIDYTLIEDGGDGDPDALRELGSVLEKDGIGFGVATGRSPELVQEVMERHDLPLPRIVVSNVGSEITYLDRVGDEVRWLPDKGYAQHLRHQWNREAVREVLEGIEGIEPQEDEAQRAFKLSYYLDDAAKVDEVRERLDDAGLRAAVIYSHGRFLDVLAHRASKGQAVRYLSYKWGIRPERIAVAGDSGNDEEMLRGPFRAIVVGNHDPELDALKGRRGVYFAEGAFAKGVLEGLRHWRFVPTDPA